MKEKCNIKKLQAHLQCDFIDGAFLYYLGTETCQPLQLVSLTDGKVFTSLLHLTFAFKLFALLIIFTLAL